MVRRVCLASSGTGGHLMPALALAQSLQAEGHKTMLVTDGRPVAEELLYRFDCPSQALSVGGRGPGLAVRLLRATVDARRMLKRENIDLMVCTGGRSTVPAGIAARSLGLPLCLLEQNVVTGRANRWLMPLAARIYLGLPQPDEPRKGLWTGMPMRTAIRPRNVQEARDRLGLLPDLRTLLVTGGSQGASALNEAVPEALASLQEDVQVLHLAGKGAERPLRDHYAAAGNVVRAVVQDLCMDMADAYAAADLVLCRGGAGTVAELMVIGRPAIIVPYPYHKDRHQWHNGRLLEEVGAAVLVGENQLFGELPRLLRSLLLDATKLQDMGERARRLAPSDNPSQRILEDLQQKGMLGT